MYVLSQSNIFIWHLTATLVYELMYHFKFIFLQLTVSNIAEEKAAILDSNTELNNKVWYTQPWSLWLPHSALL